jgi:hypothetical protein
MTRHGDARQGKASPVEAATRLANVAVPLPLMEKSASLHIVGGVTADANAR